MTAFSDEDIDMLRRANGQPGAEAAVYAPRVACHLDQPGTTHAFRLCAGWLATVGPYHLGVRISAFLGSIPHIALAPRPGWPELHPDLHSLIAARLKALKDSQELAAETPVPAQHPSDEGQGSRK